MESELANEARTLIDAISKLSESVSSLDKQLEQVNRDVYTTIRRMRLIVTGLVIGCLISAGAIGYTVYNGNRIDQVQRRTSNEVLCPLYRIFLDAYHPEAQPPERRQQYEDAYKVIRRSYGVLECQ